MAFSVEQPYAKLQGDDFVYYMWNHEMTLGRKEADVTILDDTSISRIHARIAFSPVRQRFEIHVMGKNGVIVNGECYLKGSPPIHLTSDSEIVIGRNNPLTFRFLLPLAPAFRRRNKRKRPVKEPLVKLIGQLIISSPYGKLTPNELIDAMANKHRARALQMGVEDGRLASSIRHAIRLYPEFFLTNITDDSAKNPEASFSVSPDHVHLFVEEVFKSKQEKDGSPPTKSYNQSPTSEMQEVQVPTSIK